MQLNDKSHKLIYNVSAYENEPDEELKAFLRFISSGTPSDSFTDRINALILQAKQAKANKTKYMSMNLHDYDMMEIGKEEGKIEDAKILIEKYNIPLEQACADLGISPDLLKEDIKQKSSIIRMYWQ